MKTNEIADKAGCTMRMVQKWAKKHNVEYHIENMLVVYDFTDEQVQQFLDRDKKRGRRWPPKDRPT